MRKCDFCLKVLLDLYFASWKQTKTNTSVEAVTWIGPPKEKQNQTNKIKGAKSFSEVYALHQFAVPDCKSVYSTFYPSRVRNTKHRTHDTDSQKTLRAHFQPRKHPLCLCFQHLVRSNSTVEGPDSGQMNRCLLPLSRQLLRCTVSRQRQSKACLWVTVPSKQRDKMTDGIKACIPTEIQSGIRFSEEFMPE